MRRVGALVVALVAAAVPPPARAATTELVADLSAENEVPEPGPKDGRGKATVTIDDDAGTLCYRLTYENIGDPVAGHVHEGAAGENGPVVVDFDLAANGDEGCVSADPDELGHIAEDPGAHYVNLHTADYPKGAVRGQLSAGGGASEG